MNDVNIAEAIESAKRVYKALRREYKQLERYARRNRLLDADCKAAYDAMLRAKDHLDYMQSGEKCYQDWEAKREAEYRARKEAEIFYERDIS